MEEAVIKTLTRTHELQWIVTNELESLPLDELLLSVQQIEAQQGSRSPALATLYDRLGQAYRSRVIVGKAENVQQEIELSMAYFQKAIDLLTARGDKFNLANTLIRLGNFYNELGRYKQAILTHQQSLEIAREIGNDGGKADSLNNLGNTYYSLGQYNRAIDFHEQSLVIQREIGNRFGEASSLFNKGYTLAKLDKHGEALQFYQQAKQIFEELQLDRMVEKCNVAIAKQKTVRSTK